MPARRSKSTTSTPVKLENGTPVKSTQVVAPSPSRKLPRKIAPPSKTDVFPDDEVVTAVASSSKKRSRVIANADGPTKAEGSAGKKGRKSAVEVKTEELIAVAKEEIEAAADQPEVKAVKKPRGKAKIWPPEKLDPSLHPPRSGFPAYDLPKLEGKVNGGISLPSTVPKPHYVGAHCSIGGGAAGALLRAGLAGFNGVALFVKNQKQWKSNPMEEETIERFRTLMKRKEDGGLDYPAETILVHGSYLINVANPDPTKWNLSYSCFKDDIERCYQLGIRLYNWHPGSTVGACSREEGYANIARAINNVHEEVPEVITVIENMANARSNVMGTTFEDLAGIIALVKDQSRVRICLDTCHMFAAGYDIRTPETYAETMRKFEEVVGFKHLAGLHLNDSKADFDSCKDLHENIGLGHIGLTAFRCIMRDPKMSGIPMILETPMNPDNQEGEAMLLEAMETKMLYEIQAIPDEEWEVKKVEIEERWRADRDRINPPKVKEKKPKVKKEKGGAKVKKSKVKDEEACESHGEESDEDD